MGFVGNVGATPYRLKEVTTNEELTDIEEIHFIELPKSRHVSKDEVLRKAKNQLYKINLDKDSIARYREIEKRMYDEISALDYAEKKGIKIGIQKGAKIGELKAKYDLARNSLSKGLPISLISELTGLSEDEINKL